MQETPKRKAVQQLEINCNSVASVVGVSFLLLPSAMLRRVFNLEDVAADFSLMPKLPPSPYQLADVKPAVTGEARRVKVPSRFVLVEDIPLCSRVSDTGSKQIAARKLPTAAGPMGWKADAARVERLALARVLVGLARAVAKHSAAYSAVLSALEGVEAEDIAFLF